MRATRAPLVLGRDGIPVGTPDLHGIQTLGFDVLAWAEEYLAQPDGVYAGDPWQWTPTQARIVLWWYAVDDEGRWLYRRGQIVLPKGSGKSPFAAALSCCELAAPVLFDGWDADGFAVGRPHPSPHVQIAAVSQDQTSNTFSLIIAMLREGRAADELVGLDTGVTRVLTRMGRLEPVTASASSREGQRLTAAILDEPHLWLANNGGHRLAAVLRRNLGKMDGRSIETTNAWTPGADSVAEQSSAYADLIEEQSKEGGRHRVREAGMLRYHPKASVSDLSDETAVREALGELYKDAPWIDIDRILAEIWDPGTHPADARRFYLNEVTTAEDALVAAADWDAGYVDDVLDPVEDEVVLGFDASKSDDSTVLVAMRVRDRFATVLAAQEKPDGAMGVGWEVDREYFDGVIANTFANFKKVVAFYSDVAHVESYVDKWSAEYGSRLVVKASPKSPVGWDMRGRLQLLTLATERLVAGIQDGEVHHDGGGLLRRHVLNAHRRPNQYGISFGKERKDSPRKVDGFAALQLADMARADYVAEISKHRQRSGKVW
jgi:hypothetical protein